MRAQQVIASDIDALEERMWHDVNEYQLALQQHLSNRDGLLNKIDRASQQLLLLKVCVLENRADSGCRLRGWGVRHVCAAARGGLSSCQCCNCALCHERLRARGFRWAGRTPCVCRPACIQQTSAINSRPRQLRSPRPDPLATLLAAHAQSTNVLNDTFRIWHDGPFGTICGFRLGRTPEHPVDWNEINAAWGQAVLLLHTMAQQCKLNFSGSCAAFAALWAVRWG
jgi:hypothetical protein